MWECRQRVWDRERESIRRVYHRTVFFFLSFCYWRANDRYMSRFSWHNVHIKEFTFYAIQKKVFINHRFIAKRLYNLCVRSNYYFINRRIWVFAILLADAIGNLMSEKKYDEHKISFELIKRKTISSKRMKIRYVKICKILVFCAVVNSECSTLNIARWQLRSAHLLQDWKGIFLVPTEDIHITALPLALKD